MTFPGSRLKPDTHECPATGCDRQVGRAQLACRVHWFQIPKAIRDQVWSAYMTERDGPEHRAAIASAIGALRAPTRSHA